jgi:septal ring factor EnvC (AmiA/AmiB activator)
MENVIRILLVFCPFLFVYSQGNSDVLKREQQKLEKKIQNTKSLLTKVKSNTEASLNELRLIDNQIKSREALVRIFDNQVRVAEIKMKEKKIEITRLNKRLEDLKAQYKSMILYAYKRRNNFGKIMFILSANNYNEAIKRNKYLKKAAGIQLKQRALIKQHQQLIDKEINDISQEKETKVLAMEEKKKERESIEKDKTTKEVTYNKFKQEEQKLYTQLQADERKKQELKQKIDAAIKQEIADSQRRQREEADRIRKANEEKKRKAAEDKAKKAGDKSKTTTTSTPEADPFVDDVPEKTPEYVYKESPEGAAIGKSFEANKGRLPWPVSNGSITEKYGINAHPTLSGVTTNNNGVDITCSKGSSVRAVFEGEVTSVFSITGAGKVVIIKHGSYRTVYSNLQETFVKTGSQVSTKQAIGTLQASDGNVSICHFEVHSVAGGLTKSLNPSLWIGR